MRSGDYNANQEAMMAGNTSFIKRKNGPKWAQNKSRPQVNPAKPTTRVKRAQNSVSRKTKHLTKNPKNGMLISRVPNFKLDPRMHVVISLHPNSPSLKSGHGSRLPPHLKHEDANGRDGWGIYSLGNLQMTWG